MVAGVKAYFYKISNNHVRNTNDYALIVIFFFFLPRENEFSRSWIVLNELCNIIMPDW